MLEYISIFYTPFMPIVGFSMNFIIVLITAIITMICCIKKRALAVFLMLVFTISHALEVDVVKVFPSIDLPREMVKKIFEMTFDDSVPLHEISRDIKNMRMVNGSWRNLIDSDEYTHIAIKKILPRTNNHFRACKVLSSLGAQRLHKAHKTTSKGAWDYQVWHIDQRGFMEELAGFGYLVNQDEKDEAIANLEEYLRKGISINYRWQHLVNTRPPDQGILLELDFLQKFGETTPLILAVRNRCIPIFDLLISRPDLDVNALDDHIRDGQRTALMHAINGESNAKHMVEKLLARPDIQVNKEGVEQGISPCRIRAYDVCYDGAILPLLL